MGQMYELLGDSRRGMSLDLEVNLAIWLCIHNDMIAIEHFPVEDPQREWILDHALDRSLQRTRTVVDVVPLGDQLPLRSVRNLQRDLALRQ